MFTFQITGRLAGRGRTGILSTPHGDIPTPVFMPVGTAATVKSLFPADLEAVGARIILANNYHLYLRPGSENIKKLGGIHKFMAWNRPVLTDSGGFQIQSLRPQITDVGARFQSHIDGSSHFLTPETATKSQIDIGADIIMAFDESIPHGAGKKQARAAVTRTRHWLTRCITTWKNSRDTKRQALFGIIQGGQFPDLLKESAKFVAQQDLPGIAVGGAVIGSNPEQTAQTLDSVWDLLPHDRPLYTLGVGVIPSHAVAAIHAGADMFDCVAPTRMARSGQLYISPDINPREFINIEKAVYKLDPNPVDPDCDCLTCRTFSRAYLHHLFKNRELLYYRLATLHNLRFMIRTLQEFISSDPATP